MNPKHNSVSGFERFMYVIIPIKLMCNLHRFRPTQTGGDFATQLNPRLPDSRPSARYSLDICTKASSESDF